MGAETLKAEAEVLRREADALKEVAEMMEAERIVEWAEVFEKRAGALEH